MSVNNYLSNFISSITLPIRLLILMVVILLSKAFSGSNKVRNPVVFLFGVSRVWRGITNPMFFLKDAVKYLVIRSGRGIEEDSQIPDNCSLINISTTFLVKDFQLINILLRTEGNSAELYFHTKIYDVFVYAICCRAIGINLIGVCTGAEILHYGNRSLVFRVLAKWSLRLCSKVVYKEPYMPTIIEKFSLVKHQNLISVKNGVFDRGLDVDKKKKNQILFLNSFKKWRNIDVSIHAIKLVKKSGVNIRFDFIGARDLEEYRYAQSFALEHDVFEEVGIHYFSNDVNSWYKKSSIFVLVADHVYANNSLLEAMAAGCVPIVSDVSLASEIVLDGVNGFVVPLGDYAALADRLKRLVTEDNLASQMAVAARAHVLKNFSESDRAIQMGLAHGIHNAN
jgi:glycosyltransferase involved in cell wall biosynthesis